MNDIQVEFRKPDSKSQCREESGGATAEDDDIADLLIHGGKRVAGSKCELIAYIMQSICGFDIAARSLQARSGDAKHRIPISSLEKDEPENFRFAKNTGTRLQQMGIDLVKVGTPVHPSRLDGTRIRCRRQFASNRLT